MMLNFLKGFFVLCALLLAGGVAIAADLVSERSWVEDPIGNMTLDQAKQAPQQLTTTTYFGQGFSASAFWIRLRIEPQRIPGAQPDQRLVVRIRPAYLDEIQLHDSLSQDGQVKFTGDQYPWSQDEYQTLNFNFVIPLGVEPRDVWLRLKTTTTTFSAIEVLSEQEAQRIDWRQTLVSMVYLAFILVCLGWGCLSWLSSRDGLIKLYVVKEVVVIFEALTVLGGLRVLGAGWLQPSVIDQFGNVIFCLFTFFVVWFDCEFLREFNPHPVVFKGLQSLRIPLALAAGLALAGHASLALQLNSAMVSVAGVLILLTALSTRAWNTAQDDQPALLPRWVVMGLYVVLSFVALLNRLLSSGVGGSNFDAFYLALFYPLGSSVVLMLLLQLRANRLYIFHHEVQLRLKLAEQVASLERVKRMEQERFLAMLGHELRNPLSAVRLLADDSTPEGQKIRQAVQDMALVLDRSIQSEKLGDQQFEPVLENFNVHDLLCDLCQPTDGKARIQLSNVDPGTQMFSDKMCLSMVISNLLDNALKYSSPDSVVQVQSALCLQNGQSSLEIQVTNTPSTAGMPDPQRLFDKYYRSPSAQHQIGSGLGLYIVKGLTELLAGTIAYLPCAQDMPPRVTFRLCVPVHHPRVVT